MQNMQPSEDFDENDPKYKCCFGCCDVVVSVFLNSVESRKPESVLGDRSQVLAGLVLRRQYLPDFRGRWGGTGDRDGSRPVVHHLRAHLREPCTLVGVHHRQCT